MSPSITNDRDMCEAHQKVPQEIMEIFDYLSTNSKIVFKSQQRNEPELLLNEKVKVAHDIYERNPQTFLLRFGIYLQEKHLKDFARLAIAQSDEELHHMVRDYQTKLKTRRQDIKNRRYAALQKLIKEGEYFSEQEMMKRAPELYQELVGQYLSLAEIKARDSYDVRNTTFSGILMHTMECKEISEVLEKAKEQLENETKSQVEPEVEHHHNSNDDELVCQLQYEREDLSVPASYRQQWGNFDNENIACSSSRLTNIQKKSNLPFRSNERILNNFITAGERELLKQEFISLMHQRFLTEQDEDFDYSTVDDNTQFDDLQQINQDKEDKYFAESDDDDNFDVINTEKVDDKMSDDDTKESEDELDIYMSHLSKHHSLQQQ
uniref:DUF2052 domain-containing protein n=1 Tax=Glossina brevipalpis TaxID=37001 RepID=A0A1A9WM48_9MUSC